MRRLREILARQEEIQAEMRQLEEAQESEEGLSEEQSARVAELATEFDTLQAEADPLIQRQEQIQRVRNHATPEVAVPEERGGPRFNRNEDPFDLDSIRWNESNQELRARAATAVEHIERSVLDDAQRQELTLKIEGMRNGFGGRIHDSRGAIPRLVLATANPHYQRAFHLAIAGHENRWTEEMRQAVRVVDELRAYMGLTDGNGGYGVPVTLDPALIMTGDGSANPFRRWARVETIVNDQWRGIATGGVTAGFRAEGAESSDGSPTFTGPTVTAEMADAFVGASIEIAGDYQGLAADLQMVFQEAKDDLEATVFVSGAAGSNQPIGITTALDGTSSEVAPTTAETFALADLYLLDSALPPKYRSAAARTGFLTARGTVNLWKELAMAENSAQGIFTDPTEGQPGRLLGTPHYEASAMDDANDINAAATADNFVAVLGDGRHYLIADRVGLTVEYLPHLIGANQRPTGQRGWYAYWRVGADSINDNAFRMLSIPTTL